MITTELVKSIPHDSRALGTSKRLYGNIHTSTVGKAFIRDNRGSQHIKLKSSD